jgi:hypothetical protein
LFRQSRGVMSRTAPNVQSIILSVWMRPRQ